MPTPESENPQQTIENLEKLKDIHTYLLERKGKIITDSIIEEIGVLLENATFEMMLMHQRNDCWQKTCEMLRLKFKNQPNPEETLILTPN